jgi:hypothetical protein
MVRLGSGSAILLTINAIARSSDLPDAALVLQNRLRAVQSE